MPVVTRTTNPNGTVTESYTYHQVNAGFKIQPRLNGDRLILNIDTTQVKPATEQAGRYTTYAMSTTVTGRLGEWIPLGGVANETAAEQSGLVFSTRHQQQNKRQVYVKVELAE